MKQRAYRALDRLGVPGLLARAGRGRLTIVMYHGFTDRERGDDLLNFEGLHLHVDAFRRHLEYLRDHYTVISLDEALDALEGRRSLPDDAVVLTMDDGYRSNHALAFPLLREFSMPATVFLATDFVDLHRHLWTDRVEYAIDHAPADVLARWTERPPETWNHVGARGELLRETKRRFKRVAQEERAALVEDLEERLGLSLASADVVPAVYEPLRWSEVEEMMDSGLVSFGSHSVSHYILARCTDERIVEEVRTARAIVEERTGVPCPLFCYPNGQTGDFDERTRRAVIDAGHRCALTTVVGFNRPRDDRFTLRRVGVMNEDTQEDFVMAMCGVARWVGDAGRRWRRLREAY